MCSPIVESSGTYNLLIMMGFPPQLSLKATKIYLNDIEEAVNYCSGLSSPDSPIYSAMNRKGDNYNKCHDLLELSHPNYVSLFESWFHKEEFEDAQLIEEFIENCDFKESFFIQYIEDNAEGIRFNHEIAQTLFYNLSNSLKSKSILKICHQTLIDGYFRQMKCYLNPLFTYIPSTLNVLCDRYYSKFVNEIIYIDEYMDTDTERIKEYYLSHCGALFPDSHRLDDSFFQLYMIGCDNNMPLLTYLTDAYNRCIVYGSQTVSELFHTIQSVSSRKLRKFKSQNHLESVSIESFINKCEAFRDSGSFSEMCIKSMNALMDHSALSKPTLLCNSMYTIDDDYMDITEYIFESYVFVHSYIHKLKYEQMPIQIDIQIIPKRVIGDDDRQYVPIADYEVNIGDILTDTNCIYFQGFDINAKEMETLSEKLIKNKSNQRWCICIDRRQFEDEMYVFQTGNESDTINVDRNTFGFVNESLFNNSVNCLVPTLCGAKDELNGYMFTLSFHVISKYETRVYLYIDGFATRFYIQDLVQYLPQFFEQNRYKNIREVFSDKSKSGRVEFYNKFSKCKDMLTDSKFDEFCNLILMDD